MLHMKVRVSTIFFAIFFAIASIAIFEIATSNIIGVFLQTHLPPLPENISFGVALGALVLAVILRFVERGKQKMRVSTILLLIGFSLCAIYALFPLSLERALLDVSYNGWRIISWVSTLAPLVLLIVGGILRWREGRSMDNSAAVSVALIAAALMAYIPFLQMTVLAYILFQLLGPYLFWAICFCEAVAVLLLLIALVLKLRNRRKTSLDS